MTDKKPIVEAILAIQELKKQLADKSTEDHPLLHNKSSLLNLSFFNQQKFRNKILPKRMSIPSYVLDKKKYWISSQQEIIEEKFLSKNNTKIKKSVLNDQLETIILHPCWEEEKQNLTSYSENIFVLCELEEACRQKIENKIPSTKIILLKSEEERIDHRFVIYSKILFKKVQKIIQAKNQHVFIHLLISDDKEKRIFQGLSGLLRTAQFESSKINGQITLINKCEAIEITPQRANFTINRRRNSKNWRYEWQPTRENLNAKIPWKSNGVYLITGGGGGLGLIFAKEISERVEGAVIILVGRSSNIKKPALLNAIVEYKSVDIVDEKATTELIQEITRKYGRINGIIHSAGVIKDNLISQKTLNELDLVLSPKVLGTANLDNASQNQKLDFFITFSSVTGMAGNVGQADYAMANAFMDYYIEYRNALTSEGKRSGRSISINWPLWEKGGMKIDDATKKDMRKQTGLVPLPTKLAIKAFYEALSSQKNRVMILYGEKDKIFQFVSKADNSSHTAKIPQTISFDVLQEKVSCYLKNVIGSISKISSNKIDIDTPIEEYGIDSVVSADLINRLEKNFEFVSRTLPFKYPTIKEQTLYFIENHYQEVCSLFANNSAKNSDIKFSNISKNNKNIAADSIFQKDLIKNNKHTKPKEIAIIGVAGRYPKAENIEAFWKNLKLGKDCIEEIPKTRWDYELYYDEEKNKLGKTHCKWGGFINGIEEFDALFFNISPRNATLMDPQERLFLEIIWHLLESAGYTKQSLSQLHQGKIGTYIGASYQQYQHLKTDLDKESLISLSSSSSIANRISYFFNFQGPSIAIDTMCSSSMIAVHMACESLLRGESQVAIAGGANLSIHPKRYIGLSAAQMIASNKDSRSFCDGDGYIPAEGLGALLLKPLEQAIEDRDTILAVIKSTATNHSGRANGYYIPNPNAQEQIILENFNKADIDPATISYIEAAANGAPLGDSIEMDVLHRIFSKHFEQKCPIGSIKANIGHPEAASGIAQLTKVILQLKNKCLVPTIKPKKLNPDINWENIPFYLQENFENWDTQQDIRRAMISSFGAGGSYAHAILEEYLSDGDTISLSDTEQIFTLSAKSESCLLDLAKLLHSFLQENSHLPLSNVTYTLQIGRECLDWRLAIIGKSYAEIISGLEKYVLFVEADESLESNIPIYTNSRKNDISDFQNLISGDAGESLLKVFIRQNNLEKIALYWVMGGKISWQNLYSQKMPKVSLPLYPFAKDKYWIGDVSLIENQPPHHIASPKSKDFFLHSPISSHAFLSGYRIVANESSQKIYAWEMNFHVRNSRTICDHQVKGMIIFPATGYIDLALSASQIIYPDDSFIVDNLQIVFALNIPKNGNILVQLILRDSNSICRFEVYSSENDQNDKNWILHAKGITRPKTFSTCSKNETIEEIQTRCKETLLQKEHYDNMLKQGLEYGPAFHGIEKIWRGQDEVLSKLKRTEAVKKEEMSHTLHPALLDTCFQSLAELATNENDTYLPVSAKKIRLISQPHSDNLWSYVKLQRRERESCYYQAKLFGDNGSTHVEIDEICVQKVHSPKSEQSNFYQLQWTKQTNNLPKQFQGIYLIFGFENTSLTQEITSKLQKNNQQYHVVFPRELFHQDKVDFLEIPKSHKEPIHIIYLWSTQSVEENISTEEFKLNDTFVIDGMTRIVQAALELKHICKFTIVTKQTQAINNKKAFFHSPINKIAQKIMMEHPKWQCNIIDIMDEAPQEIELLYQEILTSSSYLQIALRNTERFVGKLQNVSLNKIEQTTEIEISTNEPFHLEINKLGSFNNLKLQQTTRQKPGKGEIEIEVHASGMNFLDVLFILGTIPKEQKTDHLILGGECAGRVVGLGENVNEFAIGDRVTAIAWGSMASYVTTSSLLATKIPNEMTFIEAATIPIVVLTAWYSLIHTAKLKKGETILIHSGAGGVGLAAIQIAKDIGAEIFATAGTKEKRELLKSLGVSHIMNSRSLDFSHKVMEITNNEGIDVVLNSLSGEFISASFSLLRNYGRFVEIGKRDYFENRKLDLNPFLKSLSFSLVDLRGMVMNKPQEVGSLFAEVMPLFFAKKLSPIKYQVFSIEEAQKAFRFMAQAKHQGKIVLAIRGQEKIKVHSAKKLQPSDQVSSHSMDIPGNSWPLFFEQYPHMKNSYLGDLNSDKNSTNNFLDNRKDTKTQDKRAILKDYVVNQIAKIAQIDKGKVNKKDSINDLGFDSLMRMELKGIIDKDLSVNIPITRLLQGETTESLVHFLLDKIASQDILKIEDVKMVEETHEEPQNDAKIDEKPVNSKSKKKENFGTKGLSLAQEIFFEEGKKEYFDGGRFVDEQNQRKLKIKNREFFDFASVNYLGFDLREDIMDAIPPLVRKWGTHPSWTRAVASPAPYRDLEQGLAKLVGANQSILFPTIAMLNMGSLPILAGENGVIIADLAAHHTIQEACELSKSRGIEYVLVRHNDLNHLRQTIKKYKHRSKIIIAIDGVYSMSAEYADLPGYWEVIKDYPNAYLFVDDAHGFGVIGENPTPEMPYGHKGNGIVRYHNMDYKENRIIYIAGLSKAYSTLGAFIVCLDDEMLRQLQWASTYIFSGPVPVASLATGIAGLKCNEVYGEEARYKLYTVTKRLIDGCERLGLETDNVTGFPVVFIITGSLDNSLMAYKTLWDKGILVTPGLFPAVPLHRGGIRASLTSNNTAEEVDHFLNVLEDIKRNLK